MQTELRRVEVVCGGCRGTGETVGYPGYAPQGGPDGATYTCFACAGTSRLRFPVAPSSLTARMLDLAEAVDRWHALPGDEAMAELLDGESTIAAALAAVRAHKDYKGVAP